MCGIAGIITLDGRPADRERVARMNSAQAHRGPDGAGVWNDGAAALGHRRLSIIDLSDDAAQPMVSFDGRHVITYNGEVYNYRELRSDLESRGCRFRTESDTEVLLQAYAMWGEEALQKFNGMWGFAIFDTVERTLFCARDRFGVKPFYYFFDGKTFVFGSEMKAILVAVPHANQPHAGYLQAFIASGLFGEGEETFFKDIRALPPAHLLRLSRDGQIRTRRWWTVQPEIWTAQAPQGPPHEVFRGLFEDAVRLRMRSDVPVGTCLSGGLDSSSIAAVSTRVRGEPIDTFSSVYPDIDCDETEFMTAMERAFDLRAHHVHPEGRNLPALLERMIEHQDMPSAAPGIYSQWYVMEEANRHVKVLLDGQGSDELIGGYHPYFAAYLRAVAFDARKNGLRRTLERLQADCLSIEELTGQKYEGGFSALRGKALRAWLLGAPRRRVGPYKMPTDPSLHPDFAARAQEQPCVHETAPGGFSDPLSQILADALLNTSIPGLLHYEDRSSMAFGIEARTPFLDVRLVEYCMQLPYDQKINGSVTKRILRDAMSGILPEPVRLRRDKKGYPTPLARWLRDELKPFVQDLLLSERTRQRRIFQPAVVERHLQEHFSGRADHNWLIWRWMTVETWFRRFVDRTFESTVDSRPSTVGDVGK